ncbi:MAG: type II toxin-antitoxin system VapC family toxin [Rectinemataceae bacterium]
MVIDSDVIIWDLRGDPKARKTLHDNAPFSISSITYMEVVQGMRDKSELRILLRQLSKWNVRIIQINQDISQRAMMYVEEYFLSKSMELADALIAATCIWSSEVLLTANDRHYKHIPNLQTRKFIPSAT